MHNPAARPGPCPSVIYELPTILSRLELLLLFPQQQPLEVELGSGDGSFLVEYAARNRGCNFIGVERLLGRIRKLERKTTRAELTNIRGVRIESSYFLQHLLPLHSATALHIYFPDPWPKRKHQRHRLINESFPGLAYNALTSHGTVFLRTDDRNYFDQMNGVFKGSPLFQEIETPPGLTSVVTDFERGFLARGVETLRLAYRAT